MFIEFTDKELAIISYPPTLGQKMLALCIYSVPIVLGLISIRWYPKISLTIVIFFIGLLLFTVFNKTQLEVYRNGQIRILRNLISLGKSHTFHKGTYDIIVKESVPGDNGPTNFLLIIRSEGKNYSVFSFSKEEEANELRTRIYEYTNQL